VQQARQTGRFLCHATYFKSRRALAALLMRLAVPAAQPTI
jgi:hypothetical protein